MDQNSPYFEISATSDSEVTKWSPNVSLDESQNDPSIDGTSPFEGTQWSPNVSLDESQNDPSIDGTSPFEGTQFDPFKKRRKKGKTRFQNKIFFCKQTMTDEEFEAMVLDSGNFSVDKIWKPIWKEQISGLKNPRPARTNRNLCKSHKKLVCSMALKSVKVTYTPDYVVVQGNRDLVKATRRGLLDQGILQNPWQPVSKPDHIHEVIPRMDFSNIDHIDHQHASRILISLIRAHNDVPSGHFIQSDLPTRLYERNTEHGDLMWRLFPWQCTILHDIMRNGEGAKLVLKKLIADVYEPDKSEDGPIGVNYSGRCEGEVERLKLIECSLKNLEDIQAMVQSQKKLLVKEYEKMGLAKNKIKSKHTTTEARPKAEEKINQRSSTLESNTQKSRFKRVDDDDKISSRTRSTMGKKDSSVTGHPADKCL